MSSEKFETSAKICKVDESLGLVFGWAIICKKNGEDYFDVQGDHIPEAAMLEASTDFMIHSRMAKDMHRADGELPGMIVHSFPLTTEIAKSFQIETEDTGLLIAMKPDDQEVMQKFVSGEYTGFSIGGKYIENEEVD